MRWDDVVPELVAAIAADTTVQGVLGGADPDFSLDGERDFVVGSLQYRILPGGEAEVYEEARLEFDYWLRSLADLVTLEGALRSLLHHETEVTIGSVKLYSKLADDGHEVEGAAEGTWMGSIAFELEYLRGRHMA